jgi:hypothetical protein
MLVEITLNHARNYGAAAANANAEEECGAVVKSMAAFETIRQSMEQEITNFFKCALKSFTDTVLK